MIRVSCDCGQTLQVRDDLAGKRAKCPKCGNICTVPGPEDQPAPSRATPPVPPPVKKGPKANKSVSGIRTPSGASSGKAAGLPPYDPPPFDSPDARAERLM